MYVPKSIINILHMFHLFTGNTYSEQERWPEETVFPHVCSDN